MKNSLILILSIFIFQSCATQDSDSQKKFNVSHGIFMEKVDDNLLDSIEVFELDKTEGVIFPAAYTENTWGPKKGFKPSLNEIKEANTGLKSQYCNASKKFNEHRRFEVMSDIHDDDKDTRKETVKYFKRKNRRFKKFCPKRQKDLASKHKQFIGYYNDNEDKMIVIQILDFREDPYNLKDSFYTSWIGGWHGWFETNREIMHYNLNTGILTVNSDL